MEEMKTCPKCGKKYPRLLAMSRTDKTTMICDECGTKEALDALGLPEGSQTRRAVLDEIYGNHGTPQERTKKAVAGTGNRWAMENFDATH